LGLSASGFEGLVKARIDPPGIAFEDLVAILGAEVPGRLDVALGVVVVMAGLRVDSRTAPIISMANRMLSTGTLVRRSTPG
jgi:hypothetical protein